MSTKEWENKLISLLRKAPKDVGTDLKPLIDIWKTLDIEPRDTFAETLHKYLEVTSG